MLRPVAILAAQILLANSVLSNTSCDILAKMQDLVLNNTYDPENSCRGIIAGPLTTTVIPYHPTGLPGPMTLAFGDGHGADAVLAAPCSKGEDYVYDYDNKGSQWSSTKFLTSILVGLLVDDGLLDYDAPMPTYFDWWSPEGTRGQVNVKHLLSHTSGFGDHSCTAVDSGSTNAAQNVVLGQLTDPYDKYTGMNYSTCAQLIYNEAYGEIINGVPLKDGHWTLLQTTRRCPSAYCTAGSFFGDISAADMKQRVINEGPGKYYWYLEADYEIVGALIEQVTGLTYEQALNRYINDPLGIAWPAFRPLTPHSGPGYNVYGSARAWMKLMAAYLSRTLPDGRPFISETTTNIIETPWTAPQHFNSTRITDSFLPYPGGYHDPTVLSMLTNNPSWDIYQRPGAISYYALGLEAYCFVNLTQCAFTGYGSRGMAPFWERKTVEGTTSYWAILARQGAPLGSKYYPTAMGQIFTEWILGTSGCGAGSGGLIASKVKQLYDIANATGSKAHISTTTTCSDIPPCPAPYVPATSFYWPYFPYPASLAPNQCSGSSINSGSIAFIAIGSAVGIAGLLAGIVGWQSRARK